MYFLVLAGLLALAEAGLKITPMGDLGACGYDQPRYINESNTYIYSPNYGSGVYPPDQDCSWLIENADEDLDAGIDIRFDSFSLENCVDCGCDYVEAFDGDGPDHPSLGKRCGGSALPFATEGDQMYLRFVSDSTSEFNGFAAFVQFKIVPPPNCALSAPPEVLTEPTGTISSPGHPHNYPDNLYCKWQVDVPGAAHYRVHFEDDFALYGCCNCDYLELYTGTGSTSSDTRRGRWYGNDSPFVFLIEPPMYVYFRADTSGNDIGFEFTYTALDANYEPLVK